MAPAKVEVLGPTKDRAQPAEPMEGPAVALKAGGNLHPRGPRTPEAPPAFLTSWSPELLRLRGLILAQMLPLRLELGLRAGFIRLGLGPREPGCVGMSGWSPV